jgi:hypothetical protein
VRPKAIIRIASGGGPKTKTNKTGRQSVYQALCAVLLGSMLLVEVEVEGANQNATSPLLCTDHGCSGCLASDDVCHADMKQSDCLAHPDFCWCRSTPENWFIGEPNTPCTTTCNGIGRTCVEEKLQVYSASTADAIFDISPVKCSCRYSRVQACTKSLRVPEFGIYIGGTGDCSIAGCVPHTMCVYPNPQYRPPTCNATYSPPAGEPFVRRF